MPVIDVSNVDTTPGHDDVCPFSPPTSWKGTSDEYMQLMRERYRDLMHGQRIVVTASFSRRYEVQFYGPYADEAKRIIEQIVKTMTR